MVEISLVYQGELHTEASHGPSGRTLITDAPVDNGGRGESFSPTDLLATALGACMLTIMGKATEDEGLDLGGSRVRVLKHMVADPRRRIGRLEVEFTLPEGVPGGLRDKLEEAAHTCPVALSIHPGIELVVAFDWH